MARPFVLWRIAPLLSEHPHVDTASRARALLDANGLRRTVARTLVLHALLGRAPDDSPFTSTWLQDALTVGGPGMSTQTVYRVLETFHRAGWIAPVDAA